jgi:hypothetical protein
MNDDIFGSITIPRFLLKILLKEFPKEMGDLKVIPVSKQYDQFFKFACYLKSQNNFNHLEILLNLWFLSMQRCPNQVTENMLEEIASRAFVEDIHGILLIRDKIEFGKWKFIPQERHIYFDGRLIFKLNEHQQWVFDVLIERHKQGMPFIKGGDMILELNERLDRKKRGEDTPNPNRFKIPKHKTSRSLRDWAFRMGNSGDRAYGTLIGTTKGRGADIFLNLDWQPTEAFFLF